MVGMGYIGRVTGLIPNSQASGPEGEEPGLTGVQDHTLCPTARSPQILLRPRVSHAQDYGSLKVRSTPSSRGLKKPTGLGSLRSVSICPSIQEGTRNLYLKT